MEAPDFDNLLKEYKNSVEDWISAIRAEESLATPDHSMSSMEKWDQAIQVVEGQEDRVKKARADYQDALRQKNYDF